MQTKFKLAMLAATSLTLVPLASHAQTAQGGSQVQEVVVTAQKRSEALVNVPIAVTAVTGTGLAKAGVPDMHDLADVVPGLHIDASGAFYMPSIRGVGTAVAGDGASSNVALYIDGVYKPQALSNDFDFIDIDSVQVLKGPQGTLFGRNATGGAILVTTKTPSFDPALEVKVGYGSYGTAMAQVYATDKIFDNLAGSFAFGITDTQGWITNDYTGETDDASQSYAGRLKLLYLPSSWAKFTLSVNLYHDNDPSLYEATAYKGYSDDVFFGIPVDSGSATHVSLNGPYGHFVQGGAVSLKSEFDFGFANLVSYSSGQWDNGFEGTNQIGGVQPTSGVAPVATSALATQCNLLPTSPCSPVQVLNANWLYHTVTYSQEFDLSHQGKGPLDWVAGLFYYYDDDIYSPFNVVLDAPVGPGGAASGNYGPGAPGGSVFPASAWVNTGSILDTEHAGISKSVAMFADATYNWGNWHFTGGARYSIDEAGVWNRLLSVLGSTPLYGSAHHFYYGVTPRGVIRYSLTPTSNVYFSYSQGYKAGLYNVSGFGGGEGQTLPVKPEDITAYEVGYKVAGHGWRLESSAFYYDYTNLQVTSYVGTVAELQNAPSSEIYGLDLHFQDHLTQHFTADFGFAWTHARYTDFKNAAYQIFCFTVCQVPGSGLHYDQLGHAIAAPVSYGLGVVDGTTNVSGGPMERTPEYSGTLDLDYTNEWAGGVADLHANISYRSLISFDFADSIKQPGYALLNLSAAWTNPSGKWTFSVIGKNVTDQKYLIEVLPNAGGFGAEYGEPVSVMGQIDYKFR